MSNPTERWFGRFSDDWVDLSTAIGFIGGIVQILLQAALFVLLFVLGTSIGIVEHGVPETPNSVLLVSASFLGVLLGGGLPYLRYTRDRFRRLGWDLSYRIAVLSVFYGLYVAFLAYHPSCGIWFALAALTARILVFFGLVVSE